MAKNPPVTHLQETGKSWLQNPNATVPYVHQEYPKRMHHAKKDSVVVNTPEEEAKLGDGYAESPAAFAKPEGEEDFNFAGSTELLIPDDAQTQAQAQAQAALQPTPVVRSRK